MIGLPMKKPLFVLVPHDYFGPVVILFDQKDGIEPADENTNYAITIPENGILKMKDEIYTFVPHPQFLYGKSYITIFLLDQQGKRTPAVMTSYSFPERNDLPNGDSVKVWFTGYRDENYVLHKIKLEEEGNKQFIPINERDALHEILGDKVIVRHQGPNRDYVFNPKWEEYRSGELSAEALNVPRTYQFMVGPINQIDKWPRWMYLMRKYPQYSTYPPPPGAEDKIIFPEREGFSDGDYASVEQLEWEADERLRRKKVYFKQGEKP
jgi:hypothetical protein